VKRTAQGTRTDPGSAPTGFARQGSLPSRPASRLLAVGSALALLLQISPAGADVLVVLSKAEGAYVQMTDGLRAALSKRNGTAPELVVTTLADTHWRELARSGGRRFPLIVSVGTQAAREIAAVTPPAAVLHTLIPRLAYLEIARTTSGSTSAIFIDQPLARQMDLIREALPDRHRIAAVLGPSTMDQRQDLRHLAHNRGLQIETEQVANADELLPALNRVLPDADVLLSVADPLIFNSNTIHHLLLTTYREHVPVIGLSRAYVDAGALAAVYSSPEQIGRQAGEIVLAWPGGRAALPAPQYPRYFAVAVNQRVAASLGLHIDDEATLLRRMQPSAGAP
jgi:putative tryptophan/tyrosine transport system substrate-binding protein